jgi:hypothetical protein
MNKETESELQLIEELKAHGWKRSRAAELTETPMAWRDPRDGGLHSLFGALHLMREREREAK